MLFFFISSCLACLVRDVRLWFYFSAIFGQVNVCWHFMVRWHHVFMHFLSLAHFDFSCMLTLTSSDWKWFWIESGTQLKNVKCFELFSERVTQERKKKRRIIRTVKIPIAVVCDVRWNWSSQITSWIINNILYVIIDVI